MSNPGPAGYEIVPLPQAGEGRLRQGTMFCCARCDNTITIPLPSGRVNPEMQANRAIREGWRADAFRPNKNRCPEHNPKAPAVKSQQEALHDLRTMAAAHAPRAGIVGASSPPKIVLTPRPLATEEKFKVRQLLDKHFDDSKGVYLDGFSDKKIGETLNIPWATVAEMREIGWGPIRTNPELEGLRSDLEALKKEVVNIAVEQNKIDRRLESVSETLLRFTDRLAKLEG